MCRKCRVHSGTRKGARVRFKCGISGTGVISCRRTAGRTCFAFRYLWGVRAKWARPFTSGVRRRENARHPDWHMMFGAKKPSPSLRLEYYDQRPSAQPVSAAQPAPTPNCCMIAPPTDLPSALADAVSMYEATGNVGALMERLHQLRDGVTPEIGRAHV